MRGSHVSALVLRRCRLSCAVAVLAGLVAAPLTAQTGERALRGMVLDSATWQPLAGVVVSVDSGAAEARTDSLGDFALAGLALGSHLLSLHAIGRVPLQLRFELVETSPRDINLGPLLLPAAPPPSLTVTGVVVDSVTGQPVVGAGISINGQMAAITGEDGAFRATGFTGEWGVNRLLVRRIGYAPVSAHLWIAEQRPAVDLEFKLLPLAVPLEEVVVEGDRTIYAFGRMRGFYRRRTEGQGHYFTASDIERRRPRFVTDMLRFVPGVYVRPGPLGRNVIEVMGRSSILRGCEFLVFLDGALMVGGAAGGGLAGGTSPLDMVVLPEYVAGMEIYTRPAQLPARFNVTGSACGAIVIWTK